MITTSKFIFRLLIALLVLNWALYSQDRSEKNDVNIDNKTFVYVTQKSNEELKLDFTKITFQATLAKTNLVFSEPLIVKCKLSNQTDKTLEFYKPIFSNELKLQIRKDDGNFVGSGNLFAFYINRPRSVSRLEPGESIEEFVVIKPADGLFKESGNFQLKFLISQSDEKKWSNTADVIVKEPKGVDKIAYDFIRKHLSGGFDLFSLSERNEQKEEQLLTEFVRQFDRSVYYYYATLNLSDFYVMTNQLEKAEYELFKIQHQQSEIFDEFIEKKKVSLESKKCNGIYSSEKGE